ncbi:unnamed protein product [Closterium sp. NIES-65]|nr:unnamed protein product [Closterium sp. NIES-65]
MLPYLHPDLAEFRTVSDIFTHLRSSEDRFRAALKLAFLFKNPNPPPQYFTLYFLITSLPDSFHTVRDQFLAMDPTELTLGSLEQSLLEAEKSTVAVAASHDTPRSPSLKGATTARAEEAGVVVVAAAEGVEWVVAGVVEALGVALGVAAVEEADRVEEAAVEGEAARVAGAADEVGVGLAGVVALVDPPVATGVVSSCRASQTTPPTSSSVSGFSSVGAVGALVAALMSGPQGL